MRLDSMFSLISNYSPCTSPPISLLLHFRRTIFSHVVYVIRLHKIWVFTRKAMPMENISIHKMTVWFWIMRIFIFRGENYLKYYKRYLPIYISVYTYIFSVLGGSENTRNNLIVLSLEFGLPENWIHMFSVSRCYFCSRATHFC